MEEALSRFLDFVHGAIDDLRRISGIELKRYNLERAFTIILRYVLIHELAHETVREASPWIEELQNLREKTLINEILTRFLEMTTSKNLQLPVQSFKEQIYGIKGHETLKDLKLDEETYAILYRKFEEGLKEGRSLDELSKELFEDVKLKILRG